jgi:hypothetical protein
VAGLRDEEVRTLGKLHSLARTSSPKRKGLLGKTLAPLLTTLARTVEVKDMLVQPTSSAPSTRSQLDRLHRREVDEGEDVTQVDVAGETTIPRRETGTSHFS